MLRQHFQDKIEEIRSDVVRMGTTSIEMVRKAVEAALSSDTDAARLVIAEDDTIDEMERRIMTKTLQTVMQEAPVARDFRFLVSIIAILSEIEKVGDDAVKLARRSIRVAAVFPQELRVPLLEMSELSRRIFNSSMRLFIDYDAELAQEIVDSDKQVDDMFKHVREHVYQLIREDASRTPEFLKTIAVFHSLEHVADRAVAVANRLTMVYQPVEIDPVQETAPASLTD